jgi:hypothetical protein
LPTRVRREVLAAVEEVANLDAGELADVAIDLADASLIDPPTRSPSRRVRGRTPSIGTWPTTAKR